MEFTATTSTVWLGNHPEWRVSPDPVTYLDKADGKVGIIGTGGFVVYRVIDNKHIVNTSDVVQCVYEKR